MFLYFASICRRPFPILHRQFSELVDSVSDQITSYHDNVLCTVILQDAHSHNWTENRPFFEVRQMFVTTFLVKSEWKCKKNVRLKFNVWRVFGQWPWWRQSTLSTLWWICRLQMRWIAFKQVIEKMIGLRFYLEKLSHSRGFSHVTVKYYTFAVEDSYLDFW